VSCIGERVFLCDKGNRETLRTAPLWRMAQRLVVIPCVLLRISLNRRTADRRMFVEKVRTIYPTVLSMTILRHITFCLQMSTLVTKCPHW
jgi:hypothetical protein